MRLQDTLGAKEIKKQKSDQIDGDYGSNQMHSEKVYRDALLSLLDAIWREGVTTVATTWNLKNC